MMRERGISFVRRIGAWNLGISLIDIPSFLPSCHVNTASAFDLSLGGGNVATAQTVTARKSLQQGAVELDAGWKISLKRLYSKDMNICSRGFATHGVATSSSKTGAAVARFYKSVDIQKLDDESYGITLDGRILKTPAKKELRLPSQALAIAIAAEWECQRGRIDTELMPLMSIAATALDQPQHRSVVIQTMLSFLPSDPAVCRLEPDGNLSVKQSNAFDPILSWVQSSIGAKLEPTHSIFGAKISEEDLATFREYLETFDQWELASAEQLAASCKSLCLAIAAVRGNFSIKQVLETARVEEDHQIEEWGLVEGGHDLDLADMKVRVAAPIVFLNLLKLS